MANGYLGKISAVVSANTGDYIRGLNESAKQTQAFASTVQTVLRRASQDAAKSFQGIYTPFQQFERALRAVSRERLSFKGFEGAIRTVDDLRRRLNETLEAREIDLVVKSSGLQSIEQIKEALRDITSRDIKLAVSAGGLAGLRKLREELAASGRETTVLIDTEIGSKKLDDLIAKFSRIDDRQIDVIINTLNAEGLDKAIAKARQLRDVADGIEGPLGAAVNRFSQLSGEVQAAFVPALGRAQTATEQLRATIEAGGSVGRRQFRALKDEVDRVAASISRLSEAQAIVGRIGSGAGLRETNPRQFDLLNRAAAATQSAAGFTGAQVSGFGIGGQQAAVDREARGLERLLAVRERIQAANQDTRGIDRAIELRGVRLEREVATYERLISAAKEFNAQRRRGADFVASQGDPTGTFGPPRQFTTLPPGYFTRPRPFSSRDGNPDGPFGPPVPPDLERQRALERERARFASQFLQVNQRESDLLSNRGASSSLSGSRDPRRRILAELGGEVDVVRRRVESLADPLRATVGPEVSRITSQFRSLARDGVQFTSDQVSALRGQIQSVNSALESRRDIGRQFLGGAGGTGTAGLNVGIDQRQLRGAAAEVEFLQGRLSQFSGEARGPAVQALERYRQVVASVFRSGAASTEQGRRAIAQARQEVVRLTAAIDGTNAARLGQQLKRAGDVARGAFGNAGLAIQQAAFAFEDFFSVTGGLDQRIRAAGNNISQLGFILGSTGGLIAGVSVAIGAQLVAQLIKWADGGKTAEDRTRSLTDALARQKTLVEELRDAFASLGESIGDRAFSGASKEAREFEKRIEAITKRQQELRRNRLLALDAGVIEGRAGVNVAQRNLESQTTVGGSVVAQRRLEEARLRLAGAENAAATRPAPQRQQVVDAVLRALANESRANERAVAFSGAGLPGAASGLEAARRLAAVGQQRRQEFLSTPLGDTPRQLIESLDAQIRQLTARNAPVADIGSLQSLLSLLQDTEIAAAADKLAVSLLRGANSIGRSLDAAVRSLDEAGIGASSPLRRQVEAAGLEVERIATQAGQETDQGRLEALRVEQERLSELVAGAKSAADSVKAFADVLDRVSTQLSRTVVQEAQSAVEQSRRRFNAAAATRAPDAAALGEDFAREQQNARKAEQQAFNIERQNRESRDRFLSQARDGTPEKALIDQIKVLDEIAAGTRRRAAFTPESAADAARLARRQLDDLFAASPEGVAAAERANNFDRGQAAFRREQEDRRRGRELLQTPAQRAGQELGDQLRQLRAVDAPAAAQRRVVEEAQRAAAPAIFGLADSVQNAILQGPSRSALSAADVSSVEGASELNRLLRGDDAARNQDLVELQKQSQYLDELVRIARDGGVQIAN